MARFSSREFLLALIASLVGIVKLFISVDDAIVEQVTAVVLAVVPAVVYIVMRSHEKTFKP
jgi:ACR3 family arsenite efflux pump ArsB